MSIRSCILGNPLVVCVSSCLGSPVALQQGIRAVRVCGFKGFTALGLTGLGLGASGLGRRIGRLQDSSRSKARSKLYGRGFRL